MTFSTNDIPCLIRNPLTLAVILRTPTMSGDEESLFNDKDEILHPDAIGVQDDIPTNDIPGIDPQSIPSNNFTPTGLLSNVIPCLTRNPFPQLTIPPRVRLSFIYHHCLTALVQHCATCICCATLCSITLSTHSIKSNTH